MSWVTAVEGHPTEATPLLLCPPHSPLPGQFFDLRNLVTLVRSPVARVLQDYRAHFFCFLPAVFFLWLFFFGRLKT